MDPFLLCCLLKIYCKPISPCLMQIVNKIRLGWIEWRRQVVSDSALYRVSLFYLLLWLWDAYMVGALDWKVELIAWLVNNLLHKMGFQLCYWRWCGWFTVELVDSLFMSMYINVWKVRTVRAIDHSCKKGLMEYINSYLNFVNYIYMNLRT